METVTLGQGTVSKVTGKYERTCPNPMSSLTFMKMPPTAVSAGLLAAAAGRGDGDGHVAGKWRSAGRAGGGGATGACGGGGLRTSG